MAELKNKEAGHMLMGQIYLHVVLIKIHFFANFRLYYGISD